MEYNAILRHRPTRREYRIRFSTDPYFWRRENELGFMQTLNAIVDRLTYSRELGRDIEELSNKLSRVHIRMTTREEPYLSPFSRMGSYRGY